MIYKIIYCIAGAGYMDIFLGPPGNTMDMTIFINDTQYVCINQEAPNSNRFDQSNVECLHSLSHSCIHFLGVNVSPKPTSVSGPA